MLGRARWLVAAMFVVAAGACGRSAARDHAEPVDAPEEQRPYPIFEALCDFLGRCKPELLAAFASDSADECVEWVACMADQAVDLRDELEDAAGCLDFVENAACTEIDPVFWPGVGDFIFAGIDFQLRDICPSKPVSPPVPEGSGCLTLSYLSVCDDATFCVPATPANLVGPSHCGTCFPRAAGGQACDDALPCVRGHRCIDGNCERTREVGEECEDGTQCRSYQCLEGRCEADPDGPPLWLDPAELLGRGCDPSDSEDPCNWHLAVVCLGGLCTRRPDLGDSCDPRSGCRAGQLCLEGRCVGVGCSLDVGEPCPFGSCSSGAACDLETKYCVPAPDLGEPCQGTCQVPYDCDYQSQVCVELRPNGRSCRGDGDCLTHFCDRGDFSPYCTVNFCSIPDCEEDCGVCADLPTAADCEAPRGP